MPIQIRALKRGPKPEVKSEEESNVAEVKESKKTPKEKKEKKQTTKQKEAASPKPDEAPKQQEEQKQEPKQEEETASPKSEQTRKKSKKKSKKSRGINTFLDIPPDFVPPTTPPELVQAEPIKINSSGKFYQAIAQLSGTVIAVDGFLHLQLPTTTIKLRGTQHHKSKLLSRLGTKVGVNGWISRNGTQLQVLKVYEPLTKNVIALAGMIKPIEEEGKVVLIVPRNAPIKTKYFNGFILTLSVDLHANSKFLRCFASFNDEGVLTVDKITASLPFLPKFVKDRDKEFKQTPANTTD